MRYDNSTQEFSFWINGVFQSSRNDQYYPSNSNYTIGGYTKNNQFPYYGYIYDHRHYDYAISEAQIVDLYNRRLSPGQEVLHVPLSNPHHIERVITKADPIYNDASETQNVARFRGQQFLWIHHIKASTLSTPAVTKTYWLYFPDQDHYYFHRQKWSSRMYYSTDSYTSLNGNVYHNNNSSSWEYKTSGASNNTVGKWMHFVYTNDGGTAADSIKYYLNGVLQQSWTVTAMATPKTTGIVTTRWPR